MTHDSNEDPQPVAYHAGYSLEHGVLARARSWVDVFGFIRLGRVLRVAGSPVLLSITLLTTITWWLGWNLCLSSESLLRMPTLAALSLKQPFPQSTLCYDVAWLDVLSSISLVSVFAGSDDTMWYRLFAATLWSILVWTPAALVLLRQGAMLVAGRNLLPLADVFTWARRRYWRSVLAACIPAASIASIVWLVPVVGWITTLANSWWVAVPAGVFLAALAIPIGILGLGSLVAVPLSWSALINEPDPDPLDSLSRGYEYLYRRPLRLFLYLVVSLAVLMVVSFLFSLIALGGFEMISGPLRLVAVDSRLSEFTLGLLRLFPLIAVYAVSWALIGGIYLLLRQDAGGQEPEDLWIVPPQPLQPLPQLDPLA